MADHALITTLVAAVVLAFLFGFLAQRLRLPPLVGCMLAGVLVGPHTPGYHAAALAQIGGFSFVLAGMGLSLGIISAQMHALVLAAALLSILVNPLLFHWAGRLSARYPVRTIAA